MRLNIATKLFIGFLFVIVLNAFYFVIVNKMDNVNGIVDILKRKNDLKNNLLRLKTLHRVQGPSIISFERIGRQESVQNFHAVKKNITNLIDTVKMRIDSITNLDRRLRAPRERSALHESAMAVIQKLCDNVVTNNGRYASQFEKLVLTRGQNPPGSSIETRKLLMDSLDIIDNLVTAEIDSAETVVNDETNSRIRDIGGDITDVKRAMVFILGGITLFSVLFALIFSRTITNSLRRLKESATQIGRADFNITPSGYPNDEIGDLAGTFFDMAVDLRNKQEELIRSKRLAAIGEVVASVNHEINNPLMIISGNAQFLEMSMQDSPPEIKERLKTILEETDRISVVTRKLREIRNPVTEDYTSSGEQMINLDKSAG